MEKCWNKCDFTFKLPPWLSQFNPTNVWRRRFYTFPVWIAPSPQMHRCFEGKLRRCRFEIFSFALVFQIRNDELQVLAVMHMSHRPNYWQHRT